MVKGCKRHVNIKFEMTLRFPPSMIQCNFGNIHHHTMLYFLWRYCSPFGSSMVFPLFHGSFQTLAQSLPCIHGQCPETGHFWDTESQTSYRAYRVQRRNFMAKRSLASCICLSILADKYTHTIQLLPKFTQIWRNMCMPHLWSFICWSIFFIHFLSCLWKVTKAAVANRQLQLVIILYIIYSHSCCHSYLVFNIGFFTTTLEFLFILHCLSSFHLPQHAATELLSPQLRYALRGLCSYWVGQNASTSWVPEGSGGVWKVLKQGPGYCIVLRSFQVEEKGRFRVGFRRVADKLPHKVHNNSE